MSASSVALPPSVRDPVISQLDGGTLKVAVVFPTNSVAQLFVLSGEKIEAHSAPFEFVPDANYGATWIEQVDVVGADAFVLRVRVRQTCGPGVYDYRFAKREGTWYVSGLDRKETECSEAVVVAAWDKSYDFRTGITRYVEYANGRSKNVVSARSRFPRFRLEDFEALNPRYER